MLIPHRTIQTGGAGPSRIKVYLPEDPLPCASDVLPLKTPLTDHKIYHPDEPIEEGKFYDLVNKLFCAVKTLNRTAIFFNVVQLLLVVSIPHLIIALICFGCTHVAKNHSRDNRVLVLPIIVYSAMLSVLFSFNLSEIWPITSAKPQQLNGFAELACAPFSSCSGFFDPSIPVIRTLRPGFSLVEIIGFSRKTALLIVLVHLKIFGFIFMSMSSMMVLCLVAEEKYGYNIAQRISRRRYKLLRLAAYTMSTVPWVLYLCSPMLFN